MYNYVQIEGGEEKWQPIPADKLEEYVTRNHPMFTTVLAVSALVEDGMPKEDLDKLTYQGPLYFDWDAENVADTIPQVNKFILNLISLGVNPQALKLYATGGKGFHCEVPAAMLMDKAPKGGQQYLPIIYKEMAFELAVDTLDLRVYSTRKGRMWRRPNVRRPNGKYKVPISYSQLQDMTPELYDILTSTPQPPVTLAEPAYALDLAMLYDKCKQKVANILSKRKKTRAANTTLRNGMPTIEAMCEGRGFKPGTGFNQISLQIATIAAQLKWSEEELLKNCAGLISHHQGDNDRYGTEAKRATDLVRMLRYCDDNPCYEFAVGAVKTLLVHPAPDLDGIPVTKEDLDSTIAEAVSDPEALQDAPDEYEGLAGVTLNKFGIYVPTEIGSKRICAVGFDKVEMLKSIDTGNISMLEADILVNGKMMGRQALELDAFSSVQIFNRFCAKLGHAFQGTDANIRGVYMKVVEKAKKTGKEIYVTSREGLDVVNIPNHENHELREPFLIWADGKHVVLEPRVEATGVQIKFQGYPDIRGQFRIDLGDAPPLVEWLETPENKETLATCLDGMLYCQRPANLAKMIGWFVSCFYRMPFHKAYGKFPLLHMNAYAGSGKTEMTKLLCNFFYYNQEPRILSPSSTLFALAYSASGSVSPPLVIDEYKPPEMPPAMHDKLKLMMRDAYNCREQQRGGGTRDNDDYRMISSTTLAAPICFIAEAMEEEAALMERVVLVTLPKPHAAQGMRDKAKFDNWQRNAKCLAILGAYLAAQVVKRYSINQLREEFDPMVEAARNKYMLTQADLTANLSEEVLKEKQSAKERTVYNYAVAEFGLTKFAALVNSIFIDGRFQAVLKQMQDELYFRMNDVNASTIPEWLKVFNTFSDMSLAEGAPYQLVKDKDYAMVNVGGEPCMELYTRVAYGKYRVYCKSTGSKPLFAGEQPFTHSLRDCPALVKSGGNIKLHVPGGSHVFSLTQLAQLGFRGI